MLLLVIFVSSDLYLHPTVALFAMSFHVDFGKDATILHCRRNMCVAAVFRLDSLQRTTEKYQPACTFVGLIRLIVAKLT